LIPELCGLFFTSPRFAFLSSFTKNIWSLSIPHLWLQVTIPNIDIPTPEVFCGLYDLIKITFIPAQTLHLLCLSEIGSPELTLLVCDLNIGWYSWVIVLVSMILGSH
jgi:hypothetical protein